MKPQTKAYSLAASATNTPRKFGVDRNAGILTGVALITAGVEARGHGIFIDQKTLTTAAEVITQKGGKLRAAITHLSFADYWDGKTDRVEEFPGWYSAITVKGNVLTADKLEFYDTFKTDQPKLFARLLEMAEKTPDLFGISLEPWGYLVYVGEDDVEYSERPKDIALKYDGLPALRVTDLSYGAIVDDPAANPGGIFASLSARLGDSELVAKIRALFAGKSAPAQNTVTSDPSSESPAQAQPNPLDSAMKETHEKIKAAFGADKAKFSRAMTILGEKPEISFADLSAEMSKQEITELQTQLGTLTTAKTDLSTQVTQLTKERDEWKGKFEALKNSGSVGTVDLGAGTTGGAANEPNPWAKDSVNLTRQIEIMNADPARAAALKAAAGVK